MYPQKDNALQTEVMFFLQRNSHAERTKVDSRHNGHILRLSV
jgi:uncharacterized protein YeaC (DUF1315 family)